MVSWTIHVMWCIITQVNQVMFLIWSNSSALLTLLRKTNVCPTPTSQEFPESKKRLRAFPLMWLTEWRNGNKKRKMSVGNFFYNALNSEMNSHYFVPWVQMKCSCSYLPAEGDENVFNFLFNCWFNYFHNISHLQYVCVCSDNIYLLSHKRYISF